MTVRAAQLFKTKPSEQLNIIIINITIAMQTLITINTDYHGEYGGNNSDYVHGDDDDYDEADEILPHKYQLLCSMMMMNMVTMMLLMMMIWRLKSCLTAISFCA